MPERRVVLVSGGSRGLGAALIDEFLASGDSVATFSRNPTEQIEAWTRDDALAERFLYRQVDATDSQAVASFVSSIATELGNIDVLINNAGIAHDGVLALLAEDAIDQLLDVNIRSTIFLTKQVVRGMLAHRRGRILNISSVAGLAGYRGLSVYSATKAALDGFTRSLARELGSRSVTVNSIAPGYLRTEMTHGLDPAQMAKIVRRTPLGRLGEPHDITKLALFLASDDAAFITGQVFVVDGGLNC